MSVNLGSAHGRIDIDSSGVARGLSQASGALAAFERSAGGVGRSIAGVAVNIAKFGAVLGAVGGGALAYAITQASSFEQRMSAVGAVSQATGSQLSALKELAIQLGQATDLAGISAADAAVAMEELAKGGIGVEDILGGAARGALLLASAGGIGVAQAAETAATAINIFGLKGTDMAHVADLMAAAANSSSIGVDDLRMSLQQGGLVAAQFGLSIEEVTAVFGAFGTAGLRNSDAGTAFKTMLLQMVGPTKQAKDVMNEYGISFFDANGKMKSMTDVARTLRTSLGGLSDEQRLAALETIFNSDAIRAATVMYNQGADGITGWLNKVDQAGSAARLGAGRMDNLRGSMEQLKSSVETAAIKFGAAMTPAFRTVIDSATNSVNAIVASNTAVEVLATVSDVLATALIRGGSAIKSFAKAGLAFFRALFTGDFNSVFGPLITGISTAFGSGAAGAVTIFVSKFLRAAQLLRDGVITVRQALSGQWTTDPSIQPVIATIGRFVQLARDAVITIKEAWAGKWVSADGIQPVVDALGRITLGAKEFFDRIKDAGAKFAEVFTPERRAILARLALDFLDAAQAINDWKLDTFIIGLKTLGDVIATVIGWLGPFVGWLIDGIGELQSSGREVDALRSILIALGAWIALNKLADLIDGVKQVADAFSLARSGVGRFMARLLRGPRLVITTIRTVYETVGQVASAGASAVRTITTSISTVFATARDAVIWAQLYGEAAGNQIKKTITTAWDALPAPPNIPNLISKIIPTWEPVPAGPSVPDMKIKVTPEVSADVDVTSTGTDIGKKLAGGIAAGLGAALGAALTTEAGLAVAASAGGIAAVIGISMLQVATIVAAGFAVKFVAEAVARLIEQHGGIANALTELFTVAIPTALGQLTGVLANFGLKLVLAIITGLTEGFPQLSAFIIANFTIIVLGAVATFGGLPGQLLVIALGIWSIIGPPITQLGEQVKTALGTAFDQVKTIVGNAFDQVRTTLSNAVTNIGTILGKMKDQVRDAITTAFSGAGALIEAIMNGDWAGAIQRGKDMLVDIFVDLPKKLVAIVRDGLNEIADVVEQALADVGTTFRGAWDEIQTVVSTAVDNIGTAISNKLDGIRSAIDTALSNYVDGFQQTFNVQLVEQVRSGMQEIRDYIVIDMRRIDKAIQDGLDKVVSSFEGLGGRITGAVGDLGGVLFSAGSSVVQGLINGIESRTGDAAAAARRLGAIVGGAVKGALGIRSPSKVLQEVGRDTVLGLVVGMDEEQQAAAKKAAEVASAVSGAIKAGVEALKALATLRAPGVGQVGLFTTALTPLIAAFVDASGQFETDALKAASAFADSASKVAGTIKSGTDALTSLNDFVAPTEAQLLLFTDAVLAVVTALLNVAATLDAEGVSSAALFAESAKTIVDVLQPAVAGLSALTELQVPSNDQINVFGERLLRIIVRIGEIGTLLETDGVTSAAAFATNAAKIAGLLSPGSEGLTALTQFDVPSDAQITTFGERLLRIIVRIGEIGGLLEKDGVSKAGEFAANAAKVTGLLSSAKGFSDLASFKPPSEAVLNQFVSLTALVVARIGEAASKIGEAGIKGAGLYGENASKAVGLIGTALTAFKEMGTFVAPSAAAIDGLVSVTGYTVDRLMGLATRYDPAALGRLTAFAEAADKGFSALKSALSAAKDITSAQDGPKPVDAVNTIIGQLQTGLGPLQALAGLAGQWETLSATIRTKLGAAFLDLGATVAGVTGGGAAALAVAGGVTTTTRSEITVRLEMPADDGRFVARSLRVDGRSRGEVADMIAGEIAAVGAAA